MAEINIPGISDKYKTNDLIEGLMKVERVPLTREQETLDKFKEQRDAWRAINQRMSALRESVKSLYSFENPFNNKFAQSTDEAAITATPGRDAAFGDFKVDVLHPAATDRFLSKELESSAKVPAGTYTYQIGDKTVNMNWRGGSLSEFVSALNKRGNNILKASLIGTNGKNKSLLLEALKTGKDNNLVFKDDALAFALDTEMIGKDDSAAVSFGNSLDDIRPPTQLEEQNPQIGMPSIAAGNISMDANGYVIPPRGGMSLDVPEDVSANGMRLEFDIVQNAVEDITIAINEGQMEPELSGPGYVEYGGLTVENNPSADALPEIKPRLPAPLEPVESDEFVFVRTADGTVQNVPTADFEVLDGVIKVSIDLRAYPEADAVEVRNPNTAKALAVTHVSAFESNNDGYVPKHPVSKADDAVIKYEGVTITRPTNDIDDVVPNVTLNVHAPTEKTATLSIKPDTESAKDALITFVGRYNQVIADINILTQNKPELIAELDYLTKEEKDESMERLGMFQGDSSLNSSKSSMQRIITSNYVQTKNPDITMLSQIGISSNASGTTGGYNPTQLRGYLEVDEKKLDTELEEHLDQIKNLFGFDSDGDLIIDTGIGKQLDSQLTAWVQSGGLIANKTGALDRRITTSETKIKTLESQLALKESQLRQKYGAMEGSLNSLQGQSDSLTNFANRNNNNR